MDRTPAPPQGPGEAVGRGVSETTVANSEEVDAALLASIRDGAEPELDPSRP